jgi:hypothetical protein
MAKQSLTQKIPGLATANEIYSRLDRRAVQALAEASQKMRIDYHLFSRFLCFGIGVLMTGKMVSISNS